jgi:hypothetical protein
MRSDRLIILVLHQGLRLQPQVVQAARESQTLTTNNYIYCYNKGNWMYQFFGDRL